MDLNKIRKERKKWYLWKNIAPIYEKLNNITISDEKYKIDDWIEVYGKCNKEEIEELALMLKPWRKGPFEVCSIKIDSEWRSYIKYNLIKKYVNLDNKIVADVGCNNGYYMFRMKNDFNIKKLVGFDPSVLFKLQFDFINKFIKSDITYELLGVEHLEFYEHRFDFIFMLGVLYHRSDPISTLKSLNKSLNKNGEILIDTFIIGDLDTTDEVALTPKDRYSKIPNIYFIPTIAALKNWLYRAKFDDIEVLEISKTTTDEQRKTEWIDSFSLEEFLDESKEYTVEGYPAPKRAYVKARKV